MAAYARRGNFKGSQQQSNTDMQQPRSAKAAPLGPPRSEMEAMQFLYGDNGTSKFRQLPCRTFISVGNCPYRERCVYLHDPRLLSPDSKSKTRRKNKEDAVLDAYFWPCLKPDVVQQRLDTNKQPTVAQEYNVPTPKDDEYRRHDAATFSMWMHFCDTCSSGQQLQGKASQKRDFAELALADSSASVNQYSKERRLDTFRLLSNGRDVGAGVGVGPDTDEVKAVASRPANAWGLLAAGDGAGKLVHAAVSVDGTGLALHASAIQALSANPMPMSRATPRLRVSRELSPFPLYPEPTTVTLPVTQLPALVESHSWNSLSSANHVPARAPLFFSSAGGADGRPAASTSAFAPFAAARNFQGAGTFGNGSMMGMGPATHNLFGDLPSELSFLNSTTRLAKSRVTTPLFFERERQADTPDRFESFGRDFNYPLTPIYARSANASFMASASASAEDIDTTGTDTSGSSPSAADFASLNPLASTFVPATVGSIMSTSCVLTASSLSPFSLPSPRLRTHSVDTTQGSWTGTTDGDSSAFSPAGSSSGSGREPQFFVPKMFVPIDSPTATSDDNALLAHAFMDMDLEVEQTFSALRVVSPAVPSKFLNSPTSISYNFSCESSPVNSPVSTRVQPSPASRMLPSHVFPSIFDCETDANDSRLAPQWAGKSRGTESGGFVTPFRETHTSLFGVRASGPETLEDIMDEWDRKREAINAPLLAPSWGMDDYDGLIDIGGSSDSFDDRSRLLFSSLAEDYTGYHSAERQRREWCLRNVSDLVSDQ